MTAGSPFLAGGVRGGHETFSQLFHRFSMCFSWVEQRFYIGFHHFLGETLRFYTFFWDEHGFYMFFLDDHHVPPFLKGDNTLYPSCMWVLHISNLQENAPTNHGFSWNCPGLFKHNAVG